MKHLFGMAKSSLDLRGGKGRNLELDFLRLVYAVQYFQRAHDLAHGYLVVLGDGMTRRVTAWSKKYAAESLVTCLTPHISDEDLAALQSEKAANIAGMIAGIQREKITGLSEATVGRQVGERILCDKIFVTEPSVRQITAKAAMPFGINWDFYGVVSDRQS